MSHELEVVYQQMADHTAPECAKACRCPHTCCAGCFFFGSALIICHTVITILPGKELFMSTHRLRYHPLYRLWANIRQRCCNPNSPDFKNYGGRGIKIFLPWRMDFLEFYTWAIENGWRPGLEIDRDRNHLGYFPWNCSFVPDVVNQRNKRNNIYFTFYDETKTMEQWGSDPRCAVGLGTFKIRIQVYKWDPLTAFTRPARKRTLNTWR